MNDNFDPRAWNLFAGVALVTAGCGTRIASQEAGEGETAETSPEGPEETAPECVDSSDCPVGYGCYDGFCMYYPHHDGWVPYYDCYSDAECDEFEICQFNYCESLGEPSPPCGEAGVAVPIEVGGTALALSFADVDGNGFDELVVATATELRVYQSLGAEPTISAHEVQSIDDMVAGDFDAVPGEDLLLLVNSETVVLHGSNGDGSFAAGISNPLQLGFVTGLAAGDFDEQPPSDLLGWGGAGAYVDLSGMVNIFETSQIAAAAVHDLDEPEPSIALRRETTIDLYTLDAQLLSSWTDVGGPPVIAAFRHEFESNYVNVIHHSTWSRVQSRNLDQSIDEWSAHGTPEQLFAGDLDNSWTDELVYFDGSIVYVQYNPLQDGDCWRGLTLPGSGTPIDAAVGDLDDDFDEELVIRTDMGEVALFDGG